MRSVYIGDGEEREEVVLDKEEVELGLALEAGLGGYFLEGVLAGEEVVVSVEIMSVLLLGAEPDGVDGLDGVVEGCDFGLPLTLDLVEELEVGVVLVVEVVWG